MLYRKALATAMLTPGHIYNEGQVMGGLLTFDVGTKASGHIEHLMVIDATTTALAPMEFIFFDAPPQPISDGAQFVPSGNDTMLLISSCKVQRSDYASFTVCAVADLYVAVLNFDLDDKYIYAYAVCMGGTPTYKTANDLTFKLGVYLNI